MLRLFCLNIAALLLLLSPAFAFKADKPLPDETKEARAQSMFREVRCPICDGETIADSQTELAFTFRKEIRKRIQSGESNDAIRHALMTRYGEAVLLQTPLHSHLYILWLAPIILLALGITGCIVYIRKQKRQSL